MKAKKKTFRNGLRIITVPMKDTPTVTVYVLVDAGSKYETKDINGISHFLEHVCFKGTEKRPRAIDIHSEFDAIGAQSNAFTGQEFTGYYAKAQSKHLPKIVDLLSDIYLNSIFPKEEIEKEKGVIIQEINMKEDLPMSKAPVLFDKLLYGDQPAGWEILGRKEVIERIIPNDFRAYRKKHYVASSTMIVVAGNVTETQVEKLVSDAFKNISTSQKHPKKKVIERQSKPALLIHPKDTDQTHLVLGVRTFPVTDKRSPTLALLNTILGEGMSARLFQRLREEMGICYYVRSSADEYTDHGTLSVASGVDTKRVNEAVEAILGEFIKLKNVLVSPEELSKAKEYSIGNMYLGLETSDSLAGYYGIQEILKRKLETPQEVEKKIRRVTAKDIQKVAKDIFKNESLNLVIVGKSPSAEKIRKILKI
jgi:predicted Zn-dependent peptidase